MIIIFHYTLGSECGNKLLRYARSHHARTNSDKNANKDVFVRDLITGEMEVGHIIANWGKSSKKTTVPSLPKLPTLCQPLVYNPEDFIFEDSYESDPDEKYGGILFEGKYGIHTADTDDEAMNVMDTGRH